MVKDIQTWLNSQSKYNTLQKRTRVTELNLEYPKCIGNEKFKGRLDLSDFANLKKLKCGQNQITKIDASKCVKLEELYCHRNHHLTDLLLPNNKENLKVLRMEYCCQLPEDDLTFFQEFVNLEKVSIHSTKFHGSLEPLKNLTKLKELTISHTDIDSGLEYLPESIEWLFCCGGNHDGFQNHYQVGKIQEQLEPFKVLINGTDYYQYDWKTWRRSQLTELTKKKKELENKLVKQQEISQKVINQLKEENQNLESHLESCWQQLERLEKEKSQTMVTSSWAKVADLNSSSWNESNQPVSISVDNSWQVEEYYSERERSLLTFLAKELFGSHEGSIDSRESWKEQIQRLKSTLASLKGDNFDYKRRLEEISINDKELEKNNKGLIKRLTSCQSQIQDLEVQLNDEQTQKTGLEIELEVSRKENENLQKQLKLANLKLTQKNKNESVKTENLEIESIEYQLENFQIYEQQTHIQIPPKNN